MFSGYQHEKYTSQLQVGVNPLELVKNEQVDEKTSAADSSHSRHEKSERKSNTGNSCCLNHILFAQSVNIST